MTVNGVLSGTFAANLNAGVANFTNLTTALTSATTFTVQTNATLRPSVKGSGIGIGEATVDLNGGTLDLMPGPPTILSGFNETLWDNKSFPVQKADGLELVLRYVERNALSAGLVKRAEEWRWGSLWRRTHAATEASELLSDWPLKRPRGWLEHRMSPRWSVTQPPGAQRSSP